VSTSTALRAQRSNPSDAASEIDAVADAGVR